MIYLDNAATSFPKPPEVVSEVVRCMTQYCGNPGRGGHPMAMAAAEKIYECREALARMFGASGAENVVFTSNATSALNLAIKGLATPGCHFIASDMEHNSVRRPLERLLRDGTAEYCLFPSMTADRRRSPVRIRAGILRLMQKNTRAVIATACPNICSSRLPLAEIGALCRSHGCLFIVDGSQAAGHFPIDIKDMCIDALAIPSHKGLFGPQGAGALILGDGVRPLPITEGGSGSASFEPDMPPDPPERYEAGTLPTPVIAGWLEGIRYVMSTGLGSVAGHEEQLFRRLSDRLSFIPGIVLYAASDPGAVLSFALDGVPSDRVANALGKSDICVRGGIHCAPLAHHTLGSDKNGTVRVSFSLFNTSRDADALADALAVIAKSG